VATLCTCTAICALDCTTLPGPSTCSLRIFTIFTTISHQGLWRIKAHFIVLPGDRPHLACVTINQQSLCMAACVKRPASTRARDDSATPLLPRAGHGWGCKLRRLYAARQCRRACTWCCPSCMQTSRQGVKCRTTSNQRNPITLKWTIHTEYPNPCCWRSRIQEVLRDVCIAQGAGDCITPSTSKRLW